MCGICGKVSLNNQVAIGDELIQKMANVLRHRGPDDKGIYISQPKPSRDSRFSAQIGLGHRRLSVIDLSGFAHQPMSNEARTIWIVFNGEIYNFRDLRKALEGRGHTFRSNSDTEVIIHLYEEKGLDCVQELRGMFAFGLWDEERQRLLLARDRIGKKPLNYAVKGESLIFASEIKSILEDPGISRDINLEAMHLYLTFGYVPAPHTIFLGIKKLPPAHILVWEKGIVKIERYWRLNYNNKVKMNESEYCERTLDLLTEATKLRLASDVPLGAFLSGGIDSSAVVAVMSTLSTRPVKTFSIGFEDESFNELKYARRIAELFNTDHHEYIVKADAIEVLPKLIWHFDEPFADSSAIPTYYISKMTRQEVTVALNGDGGDESFAGYDRYAAGRIANLYAKIPLGALKGAAAFLVGKFPESTRKKSFLKSLKKFVRAASLPKEERYTLWMSIFDNEMRDGLYTEELKDRLEGIDANNFLIDTYKQSGTQDCIDSTLFVDVMTYLPYDLLVKVDIASMANSLEARSPFLDHKLMEFAAGMPSDLKLRGMTTKYILKKSLSKILPADILCRSKSGFGVPVGSWFRGQLKDYAFDVLLSEKSIMRGYFKKESVKRLLEEHACQDADHGQRIWSLLNLELWHRLFIDRG